MRVGEQDAWCRDIVDSICPGHDLRAGRAAVAATWSEMFATRAVG